MEEPSTIHEVGTGTIAEPLIDEPRRRSHASTVDEITFPKNRCLLEDQRQIQSRIRLGVYLAVDSETISVFAKRRLPPANTAPQGIDCAGNSCNPNHFTVLVITHDPTLTNHLQAVCMTHGAQVVSAAIMPEDDDVDPRVELSAFGLIVVDLAVFGDCEWRQKRLGCRLLRNWTETDPTLPLLFIGTESQKRAILAIRADTVRVLTRPINRPGLARAIERCTRVTQHRPRLRTSMVDEAEQEPVVED